ncbi:TetR/AcrR family transcriptional regulator [Alkalicaulis satelles]|uniref:TetR/AcrR family transcriptional regulator n=1 Tax=Alkalicaulis satelles TaxID=2609175 RepID=A0A5M6ZIW4_9PROT|nr:TetR/AcrR family transcriptional regulator [Alkalicaulis satelles]KAA5804753.1 TetR/AcrR family transcriptional regulator [Alkalicaulis satelles]
MAVARKLSRGEITREKLLDSAEKLFALKGFHGVTVRAIAREADSDPALVAYYFGGKRELFDEVLLRRAEQLNQIRLQELEACERAAGPEGPTVEEIIAAFTHPLLDRSIHGDPGWKSYFALIGQITNAPDWGGAVMSKYFDPIVRRFLQSLRKALPDCRDEELFWSYHFLSGALVLTFAETGRIDSLSGGLCKSSDIEAVADRLPEFIAAGFRRLCARDAAARAERARAEPGQDA